ncbi:hypothetical protein [Nonomuraea dietziae]|uniref:WXG100-like domain-containing protein n=1 Tax=Nonomuraea dietziae TaxID=65515 RepID=UPI0031DBCD06
MGFDGFLVPDWAKPYVGWVVGMDWPEGDETGCFRLADACVVAAHQLVEGTLADLPSSTNKIGSEWDGDAHLAFAQHVSEVAGGKVADLVTRLINTAIALNGVGVQIQYAKYMIEATVWLLIVQIAYLLAAAMASGGASLALIPPRVALARLTVAQIAKRTLLNIALFAGIVAGMDGGIQALQMAQGRRDELDARQLVVSALSGGAMGGLMGLLSGGLSRLATPALRAGLSRAEMTTAEKLLSAASSSLYGQAAQYALTGGITTAGTLLAEGNFSWEMLAKGITSSALGADGQHLTTTLPRGGGDPPPPHRTSGEGNPSSGPPPPSPSQADPPPGSHTPSTPKGDPPSPHPGPASTSDTSGPAGAAPGHPLNQINTNVTETGRPCAGSTRRVRPPRAERRLAGGHEGTHERGPRRHAQERHGFPRGPPIHRPRPCPPDRGGEERCRNTPPGRRSRGRKHAQTGRRAERRWHAAPRVQPGRTRYGPPGG